MDTPIPAEDASSVAEVTRTPQPSEDNGPVENTPRSNNVTITALPRFGPIPPPSALRASKDAESRFFGKVVDVQVGVAPTQVSFYIHESLISTESAFACTALESTKDVAERPVITLPEEVPQIFRVCQQWLYSGLICTRAEDARTETDDEYETLVKAYILGENLKAGKFKDALVDCIIAKLRTDNSFDVTLTDRIWAGTPEGSPLRRLWLDIYHYIGEPDWLEGALFGAHIPARFLIDLSKHQMTLKSTGSFGLEPFMGDTCAAYHQHGVERCHRYVHQKAQNASAAATKGGCPDRLRPVLKPRHSTTPTPNAKPGIKFSNNPWTTRLFAPQYEHRPQPSVHADTPVLGKSAAPATGLFNSTSTSSPSSSRTQAQSSRAPFVLSTGAPVSPSLKGAPSPTPVLGTDVKADSSAGGRSVGTAWPSPGVNANSRTNLMPCPGTRGWRFQPNKTREPSFGISPPTFNVSDTYFQHISMQASCKDWSPEELRLQDYKTEKLST